MRQHATAVPCKFASSFELKFLRKVLASWVNVREQMKSQYKFFFKQTENFKQTDAATGRVL